MNSIKSHYAYLAIGYDANKARNKLALLCPLLRMQFYIGVRTGLCQKLKNLANNPKLRQNNEVYDAGLD